MNKKYFFFISIIMLIFMVIFNVNISYASETEYGDDISDIITGGDDFIDASKYHETIDEGKLKSTSDMIYKILMILGISIAVIISGILGIKFMMGSVEEKAKVQEQLIPFVVGCVVIFGAFSIWEIGVNIGNKIEDDPKTVTYTKDDDGKLYCDDCGDELSAREQRNGKCFKCDKDIEGL